MPRCLGLEFSLPPNLILSGLCFVFSPTVIHSSQSPPPLKILAISCSQRYWSTLSPKCHPCFPRGKGLPLAFVLKELLWVFLGKLMTCTLAPSLRKNIQDITLDLLLKISLFVPLSSISFFCISISPSSNGVWSGFHPGKLLDKCWLSLHNSWGCNGGQASYPFCFWRKTQVKNTSGSMCLWLWIQQMFQIQVPK